MDVDADAASDDDMDVDEGEQPEISDSDHLMNDMDDFENNHHTMDVSDQILPESLSDSVSDGEDLPPPPPPWLDPDYGDFDGVLFDPDGIGSDDDGDTVLLACNHVPAP
ncbi:hypothetical protein B0H10DRAFT_1949163 [Mycena sp. CBHHK59/15]|nr:hypothetical protein B0H10DRAFT_1949163 [Mycena sp. CBHHK59/15]